MSKEVAARWSAVPDVRDPYTAHVVPLADLVEHIESEDCICGPELEFVGPAVTGADAWLVTHHALDGRERYESD